VKNYKIPLVRYDFPLPQHSWSFDAHVTRAISIPSRKSWANNIVAGSSPTRNFVTKINVRGMSERFATEHHVTLPAFVDPTGELATKVKEDKAVGERVGIDHTPTIYVVGDSQKTPFIEVTDVTKLGNTIDQMKAAVKAETPAPKKKTASVPVARPAQ